MLEFVPAEQVDPILFAKAYYLEPEGAATKPYVLLRDALVESDRVAIVKVALRQREQLATLRVRDGVMVLNTMLWPDEVRDAEFEFLDEDITVRPAELSMAIVADRVDDRRLRPGRVHRRLPRGAAGGHRREGERRGDRRAGAGAREADRRGRPDGRAEGVGRPGEGGSRRTRWSASKPSAPTPITAAKSAKKAAAPASGDDEAPAKSTRAKATATKTRDAREEGRAGQVGGEEGRAGQEDGRGEEGHVDQEHGEEGARAQGRLAHLGIRGASWSRPVAVTYAAMFAGPCARSVRPASRRLHVATR